MASDFLGEHKSTDGANLCGFRWRACNMCNTDLLNLSFTHHQQMLIRRLINDAYNVMAEIMEGVLRNDRLASLCNLENVNVRTQMIAVAVR